jgi:hypothetical protein
MNEQRRDQSQHGQQAEHKREAPGVGSHDKQQHGGETAADRARHGEKPKTEQSSHQGGGGIRSDHRPQGK